jgi:hypothetical protein
MSRLDPSDEYIADINFGAGKTLPLGNTCSGIITVSGNNDIVFISSDV